MLQHVEAGCRSNSFVTPSITYKSLERRAVFLGEVFFFFPKNLCFFGVLCYMDGGLLAKTGPLGVLSLHAEVLAIGVALYSRVLGKAGGALFAEMLSGGGLAVPVKLIMGERVALFAGVLVKAGAALTSGVFPEVTAVILSDRLIGEALGLYDDT